MCVRHTGGRDEWAARARRHFWLKEKCYLYTQIIYTHVSFTTKLCVLCRYSSKSGAFSPLLHIHTPTDRTSSVNNKNSSRNNNNYNNKAAVATTTKNMNRTENRTRKRKNKNKKYTYTPCECKIEYRAHISFLARSFVCFSLFHFRFSTVFMLFVRYYCSFARFYLSFFFLFILFIRFDTRSRQLDAFRWRWWFW